MCDQFAISLDVVVTDVIEETSTLTNQHQEPTATVMILLVDLQVFRQVRNASREERNLNLGRTGVGIRETKRLTDACHCLVF